MPYEQVYVPAEILVDLEGTPIYYAYNDGDVDDPLFYWYTAEEDSDSLFDVRDLSGYDAEEDWRRRARDTPLDNSRTYHAGVVKAAYLSGELEEYIKKEEGK